MPRPDPIPSPRASTVQRFRRAIGWASMLSFVVAAIAVILVGWGDTRVHVNMLIATALGVFLTMLLGTGLMLLTFFSSQTGHDEEAGRRKDPDGKWEDQ